MKEKELKHFVGLMVESEVAQDIRKEAKKRGVTITEYVAHGDKLSKVEAELLTRKEK